MALQGVASEIGVNDTAISRLIGKRALTLLIEVIVYQLADVGLQVADRLDLGQRTMSTRLGQQRNVIAATLVAIGPAKVQHPGGAMFAECRIA